MRPSSLPTIATFAEKAHGTRIRYMSGCRCVPCRAANSQYEVGRAAARKVGDWNGLVSAAKARKHLQALSRAGVGRRLVSDSSGVPQSILSAIKSGDQQHIRARTERAILQVDRNARTDGTLVPAGPTWKRLLDLFDEGFSEAEICRRLGYRSKKIQFKNALVTAKTEQIVEKLYSLIMEGA